MKIFVIDTGVSKKLLSSKNKLIRVNPSEGYDEVGHGTLITSIIDDQVQEQDIYVYKIGTRNGKPFYDDVIQALSIANKYKPDIINLSLGILTEPDNRLRKMINRLADQDILIVAAADNGGALCSPARYSNVLSVIWDPNVVRINDFFLSDNKYTDLIGYGGMLQANGLNGIESVSGSSFLVPLLIVKICNNFNHCTLKREILGFFKEKKDLMQSDSEEVNVDIRKIHKAVLFPLNKEIITILNNSDLLLFEIIAVYDARFSGSIGKKVKDIFYQNISSNIQSDVIMNIMKINWNDPFDTIIVGHLKLISELYNFDFFKWIKTNALKYGKNVFYLDQVHNSEYEFNYKNDIISGAMNAFKIPIVAVVGTGSNQGKANLQFQLYRKFTELDYKASLFMTEPYHDLFGFKGWANGYGTQQLNWRKEIMSVNYMVKEIDDTGKDIIFVGTQSQILPSSRLNLGFIAQEGQNVLNAVSPDAFILVTSPKTPVDYIMRTKNYLKNYFNADVIAEYSVEKRVTDDLVFQPEDIDKLVSVVKNFFAGV